VIDFRYHLVSIVAIFIALAVGIVLGAGPLQQQLGQTLTSQVSQLRRDKADLRSQLDTQQHKIDAADAFASAVGPELVRSRLGGRSVVLLLLPDADSSVADDVTKTLQSAGAKVNGRVKMSTAWADPDPGKVTFRDQLAANLGPLVGTTVDPAAPVNERMAAILAKALVVSSVTDADHPTSQSGQALSGLREAGLLSTQGPDPQPATLVVTVAGDPSTKATDTARTATLGTWTTTLRVLDDASSGVVAVGSTQSSEPIGVVGAVRGDRSVAAKVSSVDDIALAMGRIAMVFALRQQMVGQAGQYGTGVGATAVLPPLPADAP
jgi:hypothetical protein